MDLTSGMLEKVNLKTHSRRQKIVEDRRKIGKGSACHKRTGRLFARLLHCRGRAKLVIDLIRLLKSDTAKKKPVQILVLQNIVSKLLRNNNHHHASLIKDFSGLFKSELGPTNYTLLSEVFGLARSTTASQHGSVIHLDPGINSDALVMASKLFKKTLYLRQVTVHMLLGT